MPCQVLIFQSLDPAWWGDKKNANLKDEDEIDDKGSNFEVVDKQSSLKIWQGTREWKRMKSNISQIAKAGREWN